MRIGLISVGFALLLVGCGAATGAAPGALSLGGTAVDGSGFVPLSGDQALVPGAQGGFHVWLKFRVQGLAAQTLAIHRTARRSADDRLLLNSNGTIDIGEADGGAGWELPTPYPTFLCPSPLGVNIIDEVVRFRVALSHEDGTLIDEAESEAIPRCPTDDQGPFCQRICSGQ